MKSGIYVGEWFLPNGKRYPGQIVVDEEMSRLTLEIYSYKYITGQVVDSHPIEHHEIILGYAGGEITLYDCSWAGNSIIGKNIHKISYKIGYIFPGVHFVDERLFLKGATFIFPNISSWYDGDDFMFKLKGKRNKYVNGEQVIENFLSNDSIEINDQLTIELWDHVIERSEDMVTSYKVTYRKYVTFRSNTHVPFKEFLNHAITFKKLLDFVSGKINKIQIVSADLGREKDIDYSDKFILTKPGNVIFVLNKSLHAKEEIPNNLLNGRHFLFSIWECEKDELKQIVVNWFRNDRFRNIYEYYLDSNNWLEGTGAYLSNVMVNNRFLSLVQGLEDFYRENFEVEKSEEDRRQFNEKKANILSIIGDKDPELKKWLNDTFKFTKYPTLVEKLKTIHEDIKPVLSPLFDDIDFADFPQKASEFRNRLSHGMYKDIYLGEIFHRVYFTAQAFLGICILKSLEVKDIGGKIDYNLKYNDIMENIKYFIEKEQRQEI